LSLGKTIKIALKKMLKVVGWIYLTQNMEQRYTPSSCETRGNLWTN